MHFALSSEENFTENGGGAKRFSYRQFYLGLIETVQLWSEDECDALLVWWNRCVTLINNVAQTPDMTSVPREVFMHAGESQEPVNVSNTLEARLRRITCDN